MPLTKDFNETVMEKAKADKGFRQGLITEAVSLFLEGDIEIGKNFLKDYLDAVEGFGYVARNLDKDEDSVRLMLGPSINPTLKNFFGILRACCELEGISLEVHPGPPFDDVD